MSERIFTKGEIIPLSEFMLIDESYRIKTCDKAWTIDGDSAKWYVLQVRTRSEETAAEKIEESGLETYVPMMRVWGKPEKGTGKLRRSVRPLLPSYCFARAPFDALGHVRSSDGVIDFVRREGEPAVLADHHLDFLRFRERTGAFDFTKRRVAQRVATSDVPDWIVAGAKGKICAGPFRDFVGTVLRALTRACVVIEINVFGRKTPVEVPLDRIAEAVASVD